MDVRDPVAAAALRRSWVEVESVGDHAAGYFYATLFTLEPRLRERFPIGMAESRAWWLAVLARLVSHVDDGSALIAYTQQLVEDRRFLDLGPEDHLQVKQALLHTLARVLADRWSPELAASWAGLYDWVSAVMIGAAAQAARRRPAQPTRWEAEIVAHERRTGDIAVITAKVAGALRWRAGQSVAVESHLRPRVWRYLSPANLPRIAGTVEFHVRAVPGGQLSPALVYQAQVGDVLQLSTPVGRGLTVPAGPGPDLLLLAGGTGLAPLKAIVDQLVQRRDSRKVTLIVGAEYRHELYDMDALWQLARDHRELTLLAALSSDPSLGEPHTVVEAAARNGSWHDRQIYVCGSPVMVAGTRQALAGRGYDPDQVHAERAHPELTNPELVAATPELVR